MLSQMCPDQLNPNYLPNIFFLTYSVLWPEQLFPSNNIYCPASLSCCTTVGAIGLQQSVGGWCVHPHGWMQGFPGKYCIVIKRLTLFISQWLFGVVNHYQTCVCVCVCVVKTKPAKLFAAGNKTTGETNWSLMVTYIPLLWLTCSKCVKFHLNPLQYSFDVKVQLCSNSSWLIEYNMYDEYSECITFKNDLKITLEISEQFCANSTRLM